VICVGVCASAHELLAVSDLVCLLRQDVAARNTNLTVIPNGPQVAVLELEFTGVPPTRGDSAEDGEFSGVLLHSQASDVDESSQSYTRSAGRASLKLRDVLAGQYLPGSGAQGMAS
jgi:hypothetical protein